MDLAEELTQLVQALEEAEVPYALAGGLAVAVWGAPRATKDIDLLVPAEEVDRLRPVAKARGFRLEAKPLRFRDGMELRRFTKVVGEEHLVLDLLVVDERSQAAWASRQRVDTLTGALWVVSREALIEMKAASARPQDLADIEKLEDLDR